MPTRMNFPVILSLLMSSPHRRFQRQGWNGSGMWISLQVPDEHSKMRLPYLYMKTAGGDLVPWLASQTDMLTDDWYEVFE